MWGGGGGPGLCRGSSASDEIMQEVLESWLHGPGCESAFKPTVNAFAWEGYSQWKGSRRAPRYPILRICPSTLMHFLQLLSCDWFFRDKVQVDGPAYPSPQWWKSNEERWPKTGLLNKHLLLPGPRELNENVWLTRRRRKAPVALIYSLVLIHNEESKKACIKGWKCIEFSLRVITDWRQHRSILTITFR